MQIEFVMSFDEDNWPLEMLSIFIFKDVDEPIFDPSIHLELEVLISIQSNKNQTNLSMQLCSLSATQSQ